MRSSIEDEDLMKRFLVGVVSAAEQDQVEERLMSDADYFDALCAQEDELILAYRRGELPEEWRAGFAEHILDSSIRGRRVAEMDALVIALDAADRELADEEHEAQPWWMFRRLTVLAACAALLAAAVTGVWILGRTNPAQRPADTAATAPVPLADRPVATYVLVPGLTRAELQQENLFRVPPGEEQVMLALTVPDNTVTPLQGTLRSVGGPMLQVPTQPTATRTAEGLRVTWSVPARLLPRGDYLLALVPDTGGAQEPVASRFFTIDE